MRDAYYTDFKIYLNHTDEKPVLVTELQKIIKSRGINSIIDIGAGNGDISIPLSKMVSKYLAIEKNAEYIEALKNNGINTIQSTFPDDNIDGKFDLVLASHSVWHEEGRMKDFIKNAWKLVDDKGMLLIVTFSNRSDDWTNLLIQIDEKYPEASRDGHLRLLENLSKVTKAQIVNEVITTHLKTSNSDDMIRALSFIASGGDPDKKASFLSKKNHILKIFNEGYLIENRYVFPIQHTLVKVTKL